MKFKRFLIFLVGLSMPFNNLAISLPGRNFSFGLISVALYFLSLLPYIKYLPSLGKYYGNFIWSILLFIFHLTLLNIVNSSIYNTPVFPFTMFMCFFLFLLLLLHNLLDARALDICMYGIAFGGVSMSILHALGIGVSIGEDMRLVMFGENSNALGIYMGLSSIIILNKIILYDDFNIKSWRYLFILAFIPIVILLFATGSRTAFFIFLLSTIIIILFFPTKSKLGKVLFVFIGIILLTIAFFRLEQTDLIIMQRLVATVEDGDTSGRSDITNALIPYFFKSPIYGYGQTGYVDVALRALNKISIIGGITYGYSPHNVIVELLLYTGIIGLLLWSIFWIKIIFKSIIIFLQNKELMCGILFIPVLACMLSGQLLTDKWAYIIYAYILSYYYNSKHKFRVFEKH